MQLSQNSLLLKTVLAVQRNEVKCGNRGYCNTYIGCVWPCSAQNHFWGHTQYGCPYSKRTKIWDSRALVHCTALEHMWSRFVPLVPVYSIHLIHPLSNQSHLCLQSQNSQIHSLLLHGCWAYTQFVPMWQVAKQGFKAPGVLVLLAKHCLPIFSHLHAYASISYRVAL